MRIHKNQELSGKFQNFKIAQLWLLLVDIELFIAMGSFVKWCFVSAENDDTRFRGQLFKN